MKTVYLVYPEKIGTIAPELYGHFAEHIGGVMRDGLWVGRDSAIPHIRGFRKELVEKLRRLAPPVIRWPGGCFAETYDWRDGIGSDRPLRAGWWTSYDGRVETNEVGTHEFIDFCNLVGSKPYFAVNVTSVTPLEMRRWVEYCTAPCGSTTLALERAKNGSPEPFDVAYWGIGNENWGGGGNMTPEAYALEYRRFSTVLDNLLRKRNGERTGELICGGANAADYAWTQTLASQIVSSYAPVDGMSFHYYCRSEGDAINFTAESWYKLISEAERMEELLCRHYAIVQGCGAEQSMQLVVDEWGCWHNEGSDPSGGKNLFEQQSTMRDAVVSALTLNIFNNHCDKVKMANVAQLCNNLHSLFLTEGGHCIATPNYYVFEMFRHHQGAQAIRTIIEDNSDPATRLSASASVRDGWLTLTLANCSYEAAVTVEPVLLGAAWDGEAEAYLLAGEHANSHNTFDRPENVVIRRAPAEDMHRLVLPPAAVLLVRAPLQTPKSTDAATAHPTAPGTPG